MRPRKMRGAGGFQAIETPRAVFVGKAYFWNGTDVSVDKKIARYCEREGMRLAFYVADPGTFVEFAPPVLFEK